MGKYVSVDGINTHYLEAGERFKGKAPSVLLLHSAEFGGAAELSWEFNIGPIGEHFHVIAPDHLGFGRTDKVFDFCGQFPRRIRHIAQASSWSSNASVIRVPMPRSRHPSRTITSCRYR